MRGPIPNAAPLIDRTDRGLAADAIGHFSTTAPSPRVFDPIRGEG